MYSVMDNTHIAEHSASQHWVGHPPDWSGQVGDLLKRFRELMNSNRFSRRRACYYMDLHPNALNRLHDDKWRPRLDTLQAIEHFLERSQDTAFHLEGDKWGLVRRLDGWFIDRRGAGSLGPFPTPDAALRAGDLSETYSDKAPS